MKNDTLLRSDTGDHFLNLVFWGAVNVTETQLQGSYHDLELTETVLAANASNPELQMLLDAVADGEEAQKMQLHEAIYVAARGYAKHTALFPKNREWAVEWRTELIARVQEGEPIVTKPIRVIEDRESARAWPKHMEVEAA